MLSKYKFLLLFLCYSMFSNAQTADVNSGCVPLKVNFTAPAGASTFYWDFKDGASSVLQNPSNVFINPGTYNVEFRATATGPVVGTVQIKVYSKPVPQIVTDTSVNIGCVQYTVNFSGISNAPSGVTISGYNWTFGDGYAGSGINASHTYTQPGFYAVGLELSSPTPSCNVTLLKDSFIVVSGFKGQVIGSPLLGCTKPHTVTFTNTLTNLFPIKSYSWSFGDGTTSSVKTPPAKTYADTGTYRLQCIAVDTFGCTYKLDTVVRVANFQSDFIMKDTVCVGVDLNLDAKLVTGANYVWNLSGASAIGQLNLPSTYAQYNTTGLYNVTLFTIANGCLKSKTKQVRVINPIIRFDVIPDSVCSKPFTLKLVVQDSMLLDSVKWSFAKKDSIVISKKYSDNVIANIGFDTITWSANESVCVKLYTRFGCMLRYCQPVYYPSIAHFEPTATQGCAPLTTKVINKSYTVFLLQQWTVDYGDGTPPVTLPPTQDDVTHTYVNPGKYAMRIWIKNQNGCFDTSYVTMITVGAKPHPNFSLSKTSVCPGEPITLTNLTPAADSVDQWHYWGDGLSNFSCFQDKNDVITYAHTSGIQTIQLEVGSFGCFSDTTLQLFVNGPIADFRYKQYCDSPYVVDFIDKSQIATRWLYNFGDNTTSTVRNPRHRYLADGIYTVTQTAYNDTNTCSPDTFVQTVIVSKPVARFNMADNLCKSSSVTLDASLSSGLIGTGCKLNYTWITIPPQRTLYPTYTLSDADTGAYLVGVIVENAIGCKDTAYKSFNVNQIFANVKVSDSFICLPQKVVFDANVISHAPFDSLSWDFGDGVIQVGTDSLSHTYTAMAPNSDSVIVRFFARDTFGCSYAYEIIIRSFQLSNGINSSKAVVCQGDTVVLSATNSSNVNLVWTFGNGNTSTLPSNKVVYKDTSGVIFVRLDYTDADNPGCVGAVQVPVTVNKKPVLSILSDADATQEFCFPLNANLKYVDSNSTGAPRVTWTLNNTTNYFLDSIALTFPRGLNTVTLKITDDFGCADTVTRVFNVIGPKGDFEIDTNNICVNDRIQFTIKDTIDVQHYVWDFGDGSVMADVSPVTHTYTYVPNGGSTQAKLTVSGPGGYCPYSVEKTINLKDVFADFLRNQGDTSICFGEQYLLENKSVGADSYFWDFGNGTTSTAKDVSEYSYSAPGTYTVTLSIKNIQFGCKDTVAKDIIVHPTPTAFAIGDTICLGSDAFVYAVPSDTGLSYQWSPESILNPDTGLFSSGKFSSTTPVLLTVSNRYSCTDTSWTSVFVILPPNEVIFDTIVPLGSTVILPFQPQFGYQYIWQPDTGLNCYSCPFPQVEHVLMKQTYMVSFNDTILGCFSGVSRYDLDVYPETFIKMPNTFTPNGDGANDIVYAEGWGVKKLLYFRIYNRWSELVFETNDMNVGWDGKYKNQLQNDDIYQYKVEGLDFFDRHLTVEGFLHLMH
ncbi:MAG: PKD domain-containing protein [Chitinophagales bacterium]|nr:PKD domain-containing protein [Chitinophagales bacterium]